MSRFGNKFSIVDAAFDLTSGPGPYGGLGVFIPMGRETPFHLRRSHFAAGLYTHAAATNRSKFISGARH